MTNELTQKQVTSSVSTRINQMKDNDGLMIAPNYSVSNALSSAYYALKNGGLLNKDQDSIYNALLDMVTQGLSSAKNQCYFVPYGNTVKLTRSYFGTMKVVKQLPEVKDIYAEVIYKGDDFKIKNENGRKVFVSHDTDWMNADNEIVGAYCIIEKEDGEKILTVMTKKEIDKSWSKAKTKNVQNDFPQEMAKRTVINRAAKQFFNTSDDNDLFVDAVNRTTENEFEEERKVKDITPKDNSDLSDLIAPQDENNHPNKPVKDVTEDLVNEQPNELTDENMDDLVDIEIPNHDPETGEITEDIPLFDNLGDLM